MDLTRIKRLLGLERPAPSGGDAFRQLAAAWKRRLQTWPRTLPAPATESRVAVLVTPWLGSAAPFFTLEIALALSAAGQCVTVLWDSTDIIGNAPSAEDTAAIADTLRDLPAGLEVIDVASLSARPGPTPLDDAWIDAMLYENGVWRVRGETTANSYVTRKKALLPRIREHGCRVLQLLAEGKWDWILIPGGIWGLSGIYVTCAERLRCGYTTFDCGIGSLTICQDGIACHQTDLPLSAELAARDFSPGQMDYLYQRATAELNERTAGRGNYGAFQVRAAASTASDFNVLIPLNLRWDSAALARQRLFTSVADWVVALLRWAEAEPAARICFRQHPVERDEVLRGSDDVGAMIERESRGNDRIKFVAARDDVNTYEVLRHCKVVSPYTSSVGLEAAMLRIPVVVSARNYYEHSQFVFRPESRDEYFSLLTRAIHEGLSTSDAGAHQAALYYHLVQECNIMSTTFTPAPTDFMQWVETAPETLWTTPACADLRESLLGRRPLSYLVSRRFASNPRL